MKIFSQLNLMIRLIPMLMFLGFSFGALSANAIWIDIVNVSSQPMFFPKGSFQAQNGIDYGNWWYQGTENGEITFTLANNDLATIEMTTGFGVTGSNTLTLTSQNKRQAVIEMDAEDARRNSRASFEYSCSGSYCADLNVFMNDDNAFEIDIYRP